MSLIQTIHYILILLTSSKDFSYPYVGEARLYIEEMLCFDRMQGHTSNRQSEHLCVSTQQCVDPCYACPHLLCTLCDSLLASYLRKQEHSQEHECAEQINTHWHTQKRLLLHWQHSWRSFHIRGTSQERTVLLCKTGYLMERERAFFAFVFPQGFGCKKALPINTGTVIFAFERHLANNKLFWI